MAAIGFNWPSAERCAVQLRAYISHMLFAQKQIDG